MISYLPALDVTVSGLCVGVGGGWVWSPRLFHSGRIRRGCPQREVAVVVGLYKLFHSLLCVCVGMNSVIFASQSASKKSKRKSVETYSACVRARERERDHAAVEFGGPRASWLVFCFASWPINHRTTCVRVGPTGKPCVMPRSLARARVGFPPGCSFFCCCRLLSWRGLVSMLDTPPQEQDHPHQLLHR